ncbi:S1 RNA-binding domain-containing protein [Candidatus Woesearchaeota archaeon]|nr:S1 RNA-binding domain-containing protein [Candidatus Woesearchaeota archaeon]
MFYKKQGIPEIDDLVICTVKKILPNAVFVILNEYQNKEGMIHISEIAPGRIRNLRDFVIEGKTIVCKILRIDKERGHIDLSLRRVPVTLRRKKEEEFKQENKAEKLLEQLAKENKITIEEVYKKIGNQIYEKFSSLTNFYLLVLENKDTNKDIKVEKKLLDSLIKKIKEKIKLPEVKLKANISILNKEKNGIIKIKQLFSKTKEFINNKRYKADIKYVSAPKYSIEITSDNLKNADKILTEVSNYLVTEAKKEGCEAEWQKKS